MEEEKKSADNKEKAEIAPDTGENGAKASGGGEKDQKGDIFSQLFDFFEMLAVALTIVIVMFSFIGRHSPVNGTSMYPTLDEKDLMILSSWYTPKQGDIVVFQNPGLYERPFIKRVIAVEGQTIDIDFENWAVYVDGVKLDEPYVNFESGRPMESGANFTFPLTLEKGYCWCMGDNRNHSTDSRVIGPIDYRFILGRAVCRVWPLNKAGIM